MVLGTGKNQIGGTSPPKRLTKAKSGQVGASTGKCNWQGEVEPAGAHKKKRESAQGM